MSENANGSHKGAKIYQFPRKSAARQLEELLASLSDKELDEFIKGLSQEKLKKFSGLLLAEVRLRESVKPFGERNRKANGAECGNHKTASIVENIESANDSYIEPEPETRQEPEPKQADEKLAALAKRFIAGFLITVPDDSTPPENLTYSYAESEYSSIMAQLKRLGKNGHGYGFSDFASAVNEIQRAKYTGATLEFAAHYKLAGLICNEISRDLRNEDAYYNALNFPLLCELMDNELEAMRTAGVREELYDDMEDRFLRLQEKTTDKCFSELDAKIKNIKFIKSENNAVQLGKLFWAVESAFPKEGEMEKSRNAILESPNVMGFILKQVEKGAVGIAEVMQSLYPELEGADKLEIKAFAANKLANISGERNR